MNLQVIKSVTGNDEYVLLPMSVYKQIKPTIDSYLINDDEYVGFDPADYVSNPVALARINANLTQEELAQKMEVSQAYISKIENQPKVSAKLLTKVKKLLSK